jgi:tetratricopeptide (TPR) repeat protein
MSRSFRLLCLLSLLLACIQQQSLATPERIRSYYHIAEGNYLIGDLSGAEKGIEQILRLDPKHGPTLALRARIFLDKGKAEEALRAVDAAIEAEPTEAEYQILRSLILGNHGRPTDAISQLEQAITLDETQSGRENLEAKDQLQLVRAKTLARSQRVEEAIRELHQLLGRRPDMLEATVTLASLYAMTEEWSGLEGLIAPIAEQPALRDVALYLEGRLALSRDRVGTARAKFEEALELQNTHPSALRAELLFYSALCLDRLERIDQADARFTEAAESGFEPETQLDALRLARALRRKGDEARAIALLEAALLKHAPDESSAEAWAYLGRLHQAASTHTLAISAYNQSLSIDPDQSTTRALRGSLLRAIGDLEGALADYEFALVLDPENPALLYALSLSHLQLGQLSEAEERLRLALPLTPDQAGQHLLHALLAFTMGAETKAEASLANYQALVPEHENPSAHYLAALLQADQTLSFSDPVIRYFAGMANRKEVLDWAGRAESPETARSQICAAAFWLGQFEISRGRSTAARELLRIAIEAGSPENPEWQFAHWQLQYKAF